MKQPDLSAERKVIASLAKPTGAVELSEPRGLLSLADRRLWTHLLAHAYKELGKRETHIIAFSQIRAFAAEARQGVGDVDNRRLKESVVRLQQITVQFNYLNSDKGTVWEVFAIARGLSRRGKDWDARIQLPADACPAFVRTGALLVHILAGHVPI